MMKKIITLSIVTAIMLSGVENIIAQQGPVNPEQRQRRRQGQEGRPGQMGSLQQFRGQQEQDSQSPARGAETDRKIGAMGKKRQKALAQKNVSRDRVGRRSRQSRPGRNQPMQQMFGGRGQGFRGRGMGGRNRRYQCLCPCCQRFMSENGRGFQGRGLGRGGQGFRGRGMMGQGFQGRGMMGPGGPSFQGRGMIQGPSMPVVPDVRPFPQNHPQEDVLRPVQPMRGRGMGRRGNGDFPWPGGPEPKPDNN